VPAEVASTASTRPSDTDAVPEGSGEEAEVSSAQSLTGSGIREKTRSRPGSGTGTLRRKGFPSTSRAGVPPKTGLAIPLGTYGFRTPTREAEPRRGPELYVAPDDIVAELQAAQAARHDDPDRLLNDVVFDSMKPTLEGGEALAGTVVPELPPYYVPESPSDETLVFESRFESGNLRRAVKVFDYEYDLVLNPDYHTRAHTQWYLFSVSNTRVGRTYKFNLMNLMKSTSLYSEGMRPLCYSMRAAEETGAGWKRVGHHIGYYQNGIKRRDKGCFHTLAFSVEFQHDNDTVYFAHCFPYTYSDLQHYIGLLETDPKRSHRVRVRKLCDTIAGNSCDLLTITSFTGDAASSDRRAVVITARVHPGESNASWMMKGVIDYLTGDTADARALRDHFVFKIVPMLNPDGVILGNYRCSLPGQDLNRTWASPSKKLHPTIWHTKAMIQRLQEEREVVLYLDLHGHSRKKNIFMYGNADGTRSLKERLFPALLSRASDQVNFEDCCFKVQKSKESTGRVVAWRELGITNAYTVEASFCGADAPSSINTHFDMCHLEQFGRHLCEAILDFYDRDQSRVLALLADLEAKFPQNEVGDSDDCSDGSDKENGDGDGKMKSRKPSRPKIRKLHEVDEEEAMPPKPQRKAKSQTSHSRAAPESGDGPGRSRSKDGKRPPKGKKKRRIPGDHSVSIGPLRAGVRLLAGDVHAPNLGRPMHIAQHLYLSAPADYRDGLPRDLPMVHSSPNGRGNLGVFPPLRLCSGVRTSSLGAAPR